MSDTDCTDSHGTHPCQSVESVSTLIRTTMMEVSAVSTKSLTRTLLPFPLSPLRPDRLEALSYCGCGYAALGELVSIRG